MSNYPPGVTGFEDAFGPQAEYDVEVPDGYECRDCDEAPIGTVLRSVWSSGAEDYWVCENCGKENTRDVEREEEW